MYKIDYIIGDLHLNNKGMFDRVYKNSFSRPREYMDGIIENYNNIIQDHNIVWFLGDLGDKEGISYTIPKLKGRKILILGNHDNFSKKYYNNFFEEVYDSPVFVNRRVVISHHPIPVEKGILNVHGHTHMINLKSDQHLNACPEHFEYKPIGFAKEIMSVLNNMEKPDRRFLHEWYSEMQIPVQPRSEFVMKEDGTINAKETIKKRN